MVTHNYSGLGKRTTGKDLNFYEKITVTSTTFGEEADGYQPDAFISFHSTSLMLLNEGTLLTSVIEYSFNGNTVHGELDPTLPSRGLTFDNRRVSSIWFRVKSGSSGPVIVRVDAW